MHLTRFEIDPVRRGARHLLASPHRLHAAVLAAFPESSEEESEGRGLWRLDEGRHDVVLYIVSLGKPDLTHLVETVGRPIYGWRTRCYLPFLDRLTTGERWAFRLRASPVHNARPLMRAAAANGWPTSPSPSKPAGCSAKANGTASP